ncbi:MAG: outer membrane protein [Rhodomicrobium sp.]
MKKIYAGLLGMALTSALAISANAADMYGGGYKDVPYLAVNWTGFYAGVNVGGAWDAESDQLACNNSNCGPFGGLSPSGAFGGGQLGYNRQGLFGIAPLVLGVEADIQVSAAYAQGSDGAGDVFRSRLQEFGTVRGRAGYAIDRTLLYFTGGLAYGNLHNEAITGLGDFLTEPAATGYVIGGGVEYRYNRWVSFKAEYQFIDLGKNDPVDPVAGSYAASGGTLRDDAYHTLRVGLNYFPFTVQEPLK